MAQIRNIEQLLFTVLGENRKVLGVETTNLTVAGDNYGSSMLKVDVRIKQGDDTETIHAVAKMLPQNEFIRRAFNSQFTFRNELGFYQKIAPCLRNFQKERGLVELYDSFPAFYGGRISLDPGSTLVDDDAVLLIENIKYKGFCNVDRKLGFDLEQARMILGKMAELHGTFMAFKADKIDVYNKEIDRFFQEFKIFDVADDSDVRSKMIETIVDIIREDDFCAMHIEKIQRILDSILSKKPVKNKMEDPKNPFLSLVHSDMWTNNIMVKIVDGKTVDVKFVDFQIYEYSSLTRDVIFFVMTSVQSQVLKKHLDGLLRFYYENLTSWLKKLNYDTSAIYFEAFIESIKRQLLQMEFFHIMLMLGPIFAEDQHVKGVEEMDEDALISQRKGVTKECKEKGCLIVRELITRDWL